MAKIEYQNKEALRGGNLPEKNKVTADNLNEIKASVNFIYDNGVDTIVVIDSTVVSGGTNGNVLIIAAGKVSELGIDTTPTLASTNLITSGAIEFALNNYGITVDLIDALTVDFALGYSYKINSVTDVTNAPTTTILDDGIAYVLGATIAANSVMTVSVDIAAIIQLNVTRL